MSTRDQTNFEDVALVHMPIVLVIPLTSLCSTWEENWKDFMHEDG